MNAGAAELDLGQPEQAIERLRTALKLNRQMGNRRGEAVSLASSSRALLALGDSVWARDILRQALGPSSNVTLPIPPIRT